jgi:hypothetical protein
MARGISHRRPGLAGTGRLCAASGWMRGVRQTSRIARTNERHRSPLSGPLPQAEAVGYPSIPATGHPFPCGKSAESRQLVRPRQLIQISPEPGISESGQIPGRGRIFALRILIGGIDFRRCGFHSYDPPIRTGQMGLNARLADDEPEPRGFGLAGKSAPILKEVPTTQDDPPASASPRVRELAVRAVCLRFN